MSTKAYTKESSQRRLAVMVEMRQRGKTYREIAEAVGVSAQWVYLAVKAALGKTERDRPGRKSLYTDAQWAWVTERRKEGYTIQQLAEFLGVEPSTVRAHTNGPAKAELPPLGERKAEFYRLAEVQYE